MSLLLVTKPFAPPWHDSSSGLARALVQGLLELDSAPALRVMVGATPSGFRGLTEERLYSDGGSFAPGLRQNLPVLMRLFRNRGETARHFFFAPNRRTAKAARLAASLRDIPSVHTLCSLPAAGIAVAPSLFATRSVAVSPWAQKRLADEGADVACIEPAVLPLQSSEEGRHNCREKYADYVLFAGDLRRNGGVHQAIAALAYLPDSLRLVIAARDKTADDAQRRNVLAQQIAESPHAARIDLLGRIDWIGDLVGGAKAQLLPATDLTGKMDYPLVLIEGFAAGVPAVVASEAPMASVEHAALGTAPAADARALATELERVLAVPPVRCLELYKSRFSAKRLAADYLALYRDLGLF
ncbi:MAG: glycosyltransferase [Myxococcota bacterium]|nr:glycosyltransferase [Myxococcota bacterium]